jgi:16S rRNA (guanine1516-N2)-methyltransferase
MAAFKAKKLLNIAVLDQNEGLLTASQQLANDLRVPLYLSTDSIAEEDFLLSYRQGCLQLLANPSLKKNGLMVNIEPRVGEDHAYPAPKKGSLAKALGRKTQTIIDATTGWGQDALSMWRMGYHLQCFERSVIMAVLLNDAFLRLTQLDWVYQHQLNPPRLTQGNAIKLLTQLKVAPDCIYLDPMFPPKRKKSALAKKPLQVLQKLLGADEDKEQLFQAAISATAQRVVVKSPHYAKPLGGTPHNSFQTKLVRYDVYFCNQTATTF